MTALRDESDAVKNAEVLGDRGLGETEALDDVSDGALVLDEKVENRAPSWFSDGVEGVGGGGSSRHRLKHIPI